MKGELIMYEDFGLPEVRYQYIKGKMTDLGMQLDDVRENSSDMNETEQRCAECTEKIYEQITEAQPWFEDGVLASIGHMALQELSKIGVHTMSRLGVIGVTKALKKGVRTFLLARFNSYVQLHPEIEPISKFTSKKYDLLEATENYGIAFRLAMKWGEKLDNRIETRVYSKNNKPVFAIAYGKQSSGQMYNTEFVWLDSKYKKHEDFYVASAHADIAIGHPSIERLVKQIRMEWAEQKKNAKEAVQKRVEESWQTEHSVDRIKRNVIQAYKSGITTYEGAKLYMEEVETSTIYPKDDWFL